ncbi:MAG TPA: LysM peptidoglycan-binding domain-containing protein [Anaerolineae bacterium]|nr:LysM peptidoglycan-binding domain-containing protein [Anaerolineae bacterium]
MGIFTFLLIGLALLWVFWLIFKKDMMSLNLGKLISYFAGVVFTLIIVLVITTRFLPWWADKLVEDTQNSRKVQEVEQAVQNLWQQAVSSDTIVATAIPVPAPTPVAGVPQPTVAPQSLTTQSVAGERIHTVQSGETLYRLSKTYNVTVDAIKQRNNLPNENIQVGQQLIIPAQ